MATSLAQQLQRLAVPSTKLLRVERLRPSLLFDPKEAGQLDLDTIYGIGTNGLEELALVDLEFEVYKDSLFSESSKYFQRSVQLEEINHKLDKDIINLLNLLSPYVLTRPAQKVLEWLVYRYNIHMYNVDALVACVLPFHATMFFVRVIQLIDVDNLPNWKWLKPVQNAGKPLSKATLINFATRSLNFLKFICELIKGLTEEELDEMKQQKQQLLLSFYVTSVVGVIHESGHVTEEMLTLLLPYVIKGMKAMHYSSLISASLMIVNAIAIKARLSESLLIVLVKKVGEVIHSSNEDAIKCLLVIYQNQKLKSLPQSTFMNMVKTSSGREAVINITKDYESAVFVQATLETAVKSMLTFETPKKLKMKTKTLQKAWKTKWKCSRKFLRLFLSEGTFQSDTFISILKHTLKLYLHLRKQYKKAKQAKLKKHAAKLIALLELKHGTQFDEAFPSVLTSFRKSSQRYIQEMMILTTKTLHKSVNKTTLLMLSLNHPNEIRRLAAIQELYKSVKSSKEMSVMQNDICNRLLDDNHKVVKLILSKPKLLCSMIPPATLIETLKKVRDRKWSSKTAQMTVAKALIRCACSKYVYMHCVDEDVDDLWCLMLPFLLPTNATEARLLFTMKKTFLAQHLDYFQELFKDAIFESSEEKHSNEALANVNCSIMSSVCKFLTGSEHKEKSSKLVTVLEDMLREDSTPKLKFFALTSFSLIIGKEEEPSREMEISKTILKGCQLILKKDNINFGTQSTKVPLKLVDEINVNALNRKTFPIHSVVLCLERMIRSLQLPHSLLDQKWWIQDIEVQNEISLLPFLMDLFDFILEQASHFDVPCCTLFQNLLTVFIQHFFTEKNNLVKFCSLLWINKDCANSPEKRMDFLKSHARTLSLVSHVLTTSASNSIDLSTVVPLLLISLNSEHKPIRKLTLDCIGSVEKSHEVHAYSDLLKELCAGQAEIEMDSRHLPLILERLTTGNTSNNSLLFEELLSILLSPNTPDIVRSNLLSVLDFIPPQILLQRLWPLLNEHIEKLKTGSFSSSTKIMKALMMKFTPEVALTMEQCKELYDTLKKALSLPAIMIQKNMSLQRMALEIITKAFFTYLPSPMQEDLLDFLLDLKLESKNADTISALKQSLKKSFIHSSQFIKIVRKLWEASDSQVHLKGKGANQDQLVGSETIKNLVESKTWQRTVIMLEILVAKKKLKGVLSIVPVLFKFLKFCLESEQQDPFEYTKQIILTCLHGCLLKISSSSDSSETEGLSEQDLDVNAIVQCLRISSDPETHRCALMLITLVAKLYGEAVLHNIVNIFTFMGTSLLRQDNHYKIRLMEDTLKAVIPVIFQFTDSNKLSSKSADDFVIMVIQVFVDAFPDIPMHRRLSLFVHLMMMLKPEKHLWMMIALLLEHQVSHAKKENKDKKSSSPALHPVMSFAIELSAQFSSGVQVQACIQLLQYLSKLPKDKVVENKSKQYLFTRRPNQQNNLSLADGHKMFDIQKHSMNELRYFKICIVSFISAFLGSKFFLHKLAELDQSETEKLQPLYQQLLHEVLNFSSQIVGFCDESSQKSNARFWRVFASRTYDILDKLNTLLPVVTFLEVMANLMTSENKVVRSKALELIATRLQLPTTSFTENELPHVLLLLKPLLRMLQDHKDPEIKSDEDVTVQQNTLLCIKLISRILEHRFIENLKQCMEVVVNFYSTHQNNDNIAASCILCIIELCNCLRAHSILYLHHFMPFIVNLLQERNKLKSNELLYLSVVTALARLLEILPNFLSPYLESIVVNVCSLPSVEEKKSVFATRFKLMYKNLATQIPARILLPCIDASYATLVEHGEPVGRLLAVLNSCIEFMHKDDVTHHMPLLLSFFRRALGYYAVNDKVLDDNLSKEVIDPILTLVMKLSEVTFRPFFYKLCSWATQHEKHQNRVIIFFRLVDQLADRLKGLFVLFASHVMNTVVELIDRNNSSSAEKAYFDGEMAQEKSYKLLKFVMSYLHKCFLYDNDGFVNRERFDSLMQPLVDQIENETCDGNYQHDYISPCIAQFAVAVGDDAAWKQLNYAILLKTRESTSTVRLSCMDVLEQMVQKLDKEYLSLVPETIPFLAELMEDEDEHVEQQCQRLIATIEAVVGESLQRYF